MNNFAKMVSVAQVEYYRDEVAQDYHDYLAGEGEEAGHWFGESAKALGLVGDVDPAAYTEVMLGRDPNTGQPLRHGQGVRKAKVLGIDWTFSAPKSVSLLWGLSSPEVAEQVKLAHEEAVQDALSWLERTAISTRRGKAPNAKKGEAGTLQRGLAVEGLIAALFTHRTSRAGDPELHTHATVANVVRTLSDGVWRTLDLMPVYAHTKTSGMLYQATLRAKLTERLGVEWGEVSEHGQADLAAYDRADIEEFSKRRAEVLTALDEHGASSSAAAQAAAWSTRTAKQHEEATTLYDRWRSEAAQIGFDAGVALRGAAQSWQAVMAPVEVIAAALAGETGVTERASTFSRDDVLRAVARSVRAGADIGTIEAVAEQFLSSSLVVEIDPTDKLTTADVIRTRDGRIIAADPEHRRWTTRGLLEVERLAVDRATAGVDRGAGRVPVATVARALDRYQSDPDKPLGLDQAEMVRACCLSGDGVTVIVGPPGSGKTYAARAAVDAWKQGGFTVWGAALQATAAKGLGRAADIQEARTVHSLLDRLTTGANPLTPGHVVVIDEAATVGTRALGLIIAAADEKGAKVVLIGDQAQLPAVEAGGLFRGLQERIGVTQLTEVRRFRDEAQQVAAQLLRQGVLTPEGPQRSALVRDALAEFDQMGNVTLARNAMTQRSVMVRDWHAARGEGQDAVLYATRHKEVLSLNEEARKQLRKAGELALTDELGTRTRLGESGRGPSIGFVTGDEVLFGRNEYRAGYLNADRGRIERIDTNTATITVRLTTGDTPGRLVTVPREYHDYDAGGGYLRHAYARTVHANQGATIEAGFFLASDRVTANAALVAVTRARASNRLYFTKNTYEDTVRAMTRGAMEQLALDVGPEISRPRTPQREREPAEHGQQDQRASEASKQELAALQAKLTDEMARVAEQRHGPEPGRER